MRTRFLIGAVLVTIGFDILANGCISKPVANVIAKDKEIKEDIKEIIILLNKIIEEGDKK